MDAGPSTANPDLLDLLRRVARRDHAAFRTLYDRCAPHLFAVALRIPQAAGSGRGCRAREFRVRLGACGRLRCFTRRADELAGDHRAPSGHRYPAPPERPAEGAQAGEDALAGLVADPSSAADRGASRRDLDRCLGHSKIRRAARWFMPMPMVTPMRNCATARRAARHGEKLDKTQPRPSQTVSRTNEIRRSPFAFDPGR